MTSVSPPSQGVKTPPKSCAECAEADRRGYCALGRCYCGHETCPAFDSYYDLPLVAGDAPTTFTHRGSSWDTREESTWIDKL